MTTAPTRWSSDSFLDSLRLHGDARADDCVAELNTSSDFAALFKQMTYNDAPLPPDTPRPIAEFFAATAACPRLETDVVAHPDGVDRARLERGEVVFLTRSAQFCLVLLAKSLPEGYSAPCLSEILSLSGELQRHPYRRLVGVVQLVINVCAKGGFEPGGKALVTAQQARLLHAGIRRIVPPRLPHYEADPSKNPHGVTLAQDNLQMLIDLLPKGLRFPPFSGTSRGFMTQLIGDEGCKRVGIKPMPSIPPFSWLAYGSLGLLMWVGRVWDRLDPKGTFHYTLAELFLQKMVNKEYGGVVTFKIPRNFKQVRELVEQPVQAPRDDGAAGAPRMPR